MESTSSEAEEDVKEEGLRRLFLSSSSSCEDDSELEWREAVRAALEADIQYQVRLRLALDYTEPQVETPSDHNEPDEEQQLLDLHQKRRRLKTSRNLEKVKNGGEEDTVLHPQEDFGGAGGKHINCDHGEGKARRPLETASGGPIEAGLPTATQAAEPQATVKRHKLEKERETDHSSNLQRSRQTQTVFDYLHLKYGTPYHQLEHLAAKGCFKCISGERESGVDSRIKWPKERNISLPTPELVTAEAAISTCTLDSMAADISASPPDVQLQSEQNEGEVVYDCNREVESMNNADTVSAGSGPLGKLIFESRFECGNLHKAIQIGQYEYHLLINNDLYTQKHTQWFYFRVNNMEEGQMYMFSILNLMKKDSLYNHGMKLLMYSEMERGWIRVGRNISYRRLTHRNYKALRHDTEYYNLSWTMEFPHSGDTCYFAHCYPYSYTHLMNQLASLDQHPQRSQHVKTEELCLTIGGNSCPLLTITDFSTPEEEWSDRMGVVMSARVHPGESNSSWMMQGVIEFLTSEHKQAKYLRSHYVFKLVPMLNPDGVIVGNYRTSLVGVDLNRVFKAPIQKLFPTVYQMKKMVQHLLESREIALYVDLHGHSRNHNVFMYGCHTSDSDHTTFLKERVVPWLLSQLSTEKFCFRSCKFNVQRCKISTGRVQVWKMGVANSFTMEASFCGSTLKRPVPGHFTQADLMAMGEEVCEMLLQLRRYYKSNSFQHKVHCELAQYYTSVMAQQQQAAHGEREESVVLPDLVTSTTHQISKEVEREKEKDKRKRMSKCLRRFYRMKIQNLQESSTSGSDSDNDEFKYGKTKSKEYLQQQRQQRLARHRQRKVAQTGLPKPGWASSPTKDNQKEPEKEQLLKERGDVPTDRREQKGEAKLKASSSAPPRLQRESHQPQGWRFVSKYANRSNGGIPCFSEERLKERAEKQRLRSLSTIETGSLPPLATPTGTAPASTTTPSSAPFQSQLWAPPNSRRHSYPSAHSTLFSDSKQLQLPEISALSSSTSHYKSIKGLVESQRRRPVAIPSSPHQPLASLKPVSRKLPKMPHPPPPPPPRPRFPLSKHPPPLPSGIGLPPHLLRYITEIWQKQLGSSNQ